MKFSSEERVPDDLRDRFPTGGAVRLVMVILICAGIAVILYALKSANAGLNVKILSPMLPVAIFLHELSIWVMAQRWRLFLAAFSTHITPGVAWRINLEAHFYFLIVPFGVGLDVSRIAKVMQSDRAAKLHNVAGATVADRSLGLIATLLLFSCAAAAMPEVGLAARLSRLAEGQGDGLHISGAALMAVLAAAAVLVRYLGRRIDLAFLVRCLRISPIGLVISLAGLSLMSGAVCILGRAWGIEITPLQAVVGVCGSLASQVIPLSALGAGTAEVAGLALYLVMGFSTAEAATLALALYLLRVASGLTGGALQLARPMFKRRQ